MPDEDERPPALKAEPSRKTIWEILNSNFTLFLMSSVVISGLTFAYQRFDTYRKASEDYKSRTEHLGTEIRYRLDMISSMVQPSFTYTTFYNAHGALLGVVGNRNPDATLVGEYSPIYAEFENRNLISLLWELQDLRRRTENKFSLSKAVDAARRLSTSWNENAELTDDVIRGHHDSVWHFKQAEHMTEFDQHLQIVRAAVPGSTDD